MTSPPGGYANAMSSRHGEFHLARRTAETANVIVEDGELAAAIARDRREAAARAARALVVRVGSGSWDARADAEVTRGGYGFLVLSGLLIRRVGISERIGAELLGPSDVLRPFLERLAGPA